MLLLLTIIFYSIATVIARDFDDFRIVGGYPVPIRERPFQATLWRHDTRVRTPVCGGSILNERWILTAAHCIFTMNPRQLYVGIGTDNLQARGRSLQTYNIARAISHHRYVGFTADMKNDIGLMMTDRNMILGSSVQPIKIRTASPVPNTEAIVSGFGTSKAGSRQSSVILSQVLVKVIDTKLCKKLLAIASEGRLFLSGSHFCAADLAGGRDACQGDSGGPITIENALAGIVSWGVGCGDRNVPAFYTDVSKYINWLSKTMRIAPRTQSEQGSRNDHSLIGSKEVLFF